MLGETLGPLMAIGNVFSSNNEPIQGHQQQEWPHPRVLSVSLIRNSRPIHDHQQYICAAPTGPHECIGSICWRSQLAHSCSSAEILGHNNGPIQRYRQHFSGVMLAHSIPLAPHLGSYGGPIQNNRHQALMVMLGPFETIGSIPY